MAKKIKSYRLKETLNKPKREVKVVFSGKIIRRLEKTKLKIKDLKNISN